MIKFEEEMIDLKKKISEMASLVEEMIGKSIKGLKDRNMILAQEVINSDNEVDDMELEIDNLCIKILALYHPEAGDLRVVTMIMKINNDLERIGDHAANIAKMSIPLSEQPPIKPLLDIQRMADKAIEMLKESLDSFMKLDSEMAVQVCIKDDEVDALEPQIVRELLTYVMSDSQLIDRALRLIFIARHLERVADLATNIAEDAFYIATGEVLKHHHLDKLN